MEGWRSANRRYLLLIATPHAVVPANASGQVEPLVVPARSPSLNAYSKRWWVDQ
jgi:hypothetical protein